LVLVGIFFVEGTCQERDSWFCTTITFPLDRGTFVFRVRVTAPGGSDATRLPFRYSKLCYWLCRRARILCWIVIPRRVMIWRLRGLAILLGATILYGPRPHRFGIRATDRLRRTWIRFLAQEDFHSHRYITTIVQRMFSLHCSLHLSNAFIITCRHS